MGSDRCRYFRGSHKNPYSIVWTQEDPGGGYFESPVIGFEGRLPWTKEETLDAGTVVTLTTSPNG